jgi:Polyketide cyclase / dehydrase and lipid transport
VWELLTDVAGWPAWTESMRQIQRLDGGPFALGSLARVVQPTGRPMQWTVTELEPLRNFTWTAGQPGLSFVAAHQIQDEGSQLRTTPDFVVSGPLAWLAAPISGSRIRRYLEMESTGLKRAAENTPPVGG